MFIVVVILECFFAAMFISKKLELKEYLNSYYKHNKNVKVYKCNRAWIIRNSLFIVLLLVYSVLLFVIFDDMSVWVMALLGLALIFTINLFVAKDLRNLHHTDNNFSFKNTRIRFKDIKEVKIKVLSADVVLYSNEVYRIYRPKGLALKECLKLK